MLWSAQELYILQITKLNTEQYIYIPKKINYTHNAR
jgi:hypothetical protein